MLKPQTVASAHNYAYAEQRTVPQGAILFDYKATVPSLRWWDILSAKALRLLTIVYYVFVALYTQLFYERQ